jgi:TolA-binding protein
MFVDPEITPEALHKAAIALEKTGQRDKARLLRSQLKERYPNYMAKP